MVLEILGLSAQEEALYEALVSRGPVTAAELSELTDDRAAADRLEELGLLARVPGERPVYAVTPPESALQVLATRRRQELVRARQYMTALTVRFHGGGRRGDPLDVVELLHTGEEIVAAAVRVQRSARRLVSATDLPPYVVDARKANPVETELLARGVTYRVLYDRRGVDVPGRLAAMTLDMQNGEEARVGDVSRKVLISDHPMGLLGPVPVQGGGRLAMVIHEPTMLDALSATFEMNWEHAVPLAVYRDRPGESLTDRPNGRERDLLSLLLSGLTDAQIAVHLGRTERSVRLRVQSLRARLDADTRFQAGYQAVLRGWLTTEKDEAHD